MSHSKTVHCVIEKKDALNELLEGSCLLDSEISEGLMELIIKSKHFDNSKILWIQSKGLVRALNSLWKQSSVASWLSAEVQEQEVWLQNALFFTSKVDALYFKADPETRTFTLVAQGKLLERVSAHAALKTVRRYLSLPDAEKKGEFHVTGRTITSPEQSLT